LLDPVGAYWRVVDALGIEPGSIRAALQSTLPVFPGFPPPCFAGFGCGRLSSDCALELLGDRLGHEIDPLGRTRRTVRRLSLRELAPRGSIERRPGAEDRLKTRATDGSPHGTRENETAVPEGTTVGSPGFQSRAPAESLTPSFETPS
jgi:hypothetical protein